MLSVNQLETMLLLQNTMNCKVDSNWIELNRNWYLAAGMEASEAIGHHGWKWWKKQTPDMAQLNIELVDIWHFMLSQTIVDGNGSSVRDIAHGLCTQQTTRDLFIGDVSLLDALQYFASRCFAGIFYTTVFFAICERSGLTSDELFKQYIGKNVLNIFRQDNGYKEGTYTKIWNGEEDNVHLERILNDMDIEAIGFSEMLALRLGKVYEQHK